MEWTYKKPDLHVPRNRPKPVDILAYPQKDPYGFFAKLKKRHPNLEIYTNREIAILIEECNKLMADEVATSWDGVMLPEGLGFVITGLSKLPERIACNNIDYATSNELGIKVPYQNHHSNGYVAKVMYTNNIPGHRFINHGLWTFKPCRNLQRAVSAEMKNGRSNWHKIFTKYFTVTSLFRKQKVPKPSWRTIKKEREYKKMLEDRANMLAGHDEFKFD